MKNQTYKIKRIPFSKDDAYVIEFTTTDIKWAVMQYQRNREAFNWEILEQDGNKDN